MHRIMLLLLILPTPLAIAQSDAEKFAEGRIALDKYKDCPAAKTALESVSEKGRSEPLWLFYAAKTYECLNQPDKALPLYEKYNQLMPGQTAIIDKIGDLRYQASRQRREKQAEQARQHKLEEDRQVRVGGATASVPGKMKHLISSLSATANWTPEKFYKEGSMAVGPDAGCQFPVVETMVAYAVVRSGWPFVADKFTRVEHIKIDLSRESVFIQWDDDEDKVLIGGEGGDSEWTETIEHFPQKRIKHDSYQQHVEHGTGSNTWLHLPPNSYYELKRLFEDVAATCKAAAGR